MNKSIQQKDEKRLPVAVIAVSASVFVFIVALSLLLFLGVNSKGLYNETYVAGINVSGMTKEEALEALKTNLEYQEATVVLTADGYRIDFLLSDIGAYYDYEKTLDDIFARLNVQNPFQKTAAYLSSFFKSRDYEVEIGFDLELLYKKIKELNVKFPDPFAEHTFTEQEDSLIIRTGHAGNGINRDMASSAFSNLRTGKAEYKVDIIPKYIILPRMDVEEVYKEACRGAKDARYTEKDGIAKIIPHEDGISFDRAKALEILQDPLPNTEYVVPISYTKPDITTEKLIDSLFSDKISTYTTSYNPADVQRTNNVLLASNKLSGTILAPEQIFSYNNTLGERSTAAGYQMAKVFEAGRIVDGLAGGICQVSTTLYNTVLYGGFTIVERHNHSFTVAYAPAGQDATVAFGSLDFKFKNNNKTPIRIVSYMNKGNLTVEIWGKRERFDEITITHNNQAYTPFTEKRVEDLTLEPGSELVTIKGINGLSLDSYRIFTNGGVVTSREFLGKSRYIPLTQEVSFNPAIVGEDVGGSDKASGELIPPSDGEPTITPTPNPSPTLAPTPKVEATPSAKPTATPSDIVVIPSTGMVQ